MKDLHGQAILEYYNGKKDSTLKIHTSYGDPEEMPVEVFFRDELDFTTLENLSLIECKGSVHGDGDDKTAIWCRTKSCGVSDDRKKKCTLNARPGNSNALKMKSVTGNTWIQRGGKFDPASRRCVR